MATNVVYQEPYRNIFGCVAVNRNAELGKWVELNQALKLNRYGGAFVGYDSSGKIVLATAAVVAAGKLLGWANRSVDKQDYAVGEQMHILFDNEITFQIPVDYTAASGPFASWEEEQAANMAVVRPIIEAFTFGQTFALKAVTVGGVPVQKLDPAGATANVLVSIVDIDQPGRDFVRVRMIPGKTNMA
jgi:hypothetical protein